MRKKDLIMLSQNRITWEELFCGIAALASKRSPDPHTKVGACLVKNGCVIGIGYNGAPRSFDSSSINWSTSEKYDYVIHAEMNAIANACAMGVSCVGADIFVTLSPCHECMKLIVQHQIRTVYFRDKYKDFELTDSIARQCGVKLIQLAERSYHDNH